MAETNATSSRLLSYAVGLAAVPIGFALRLAYVLHASFYIDEFTTIWAAQQVLVSGLPRFPTGILYTQGLVYTYLEAAALALGGALNPLVARLPSLILAAAMLALMVYAARRLFHTVPVGFAALWLAVDAQSILWGGRARTYSLLQVFVLVGFLAWYHGAVAGDRPRSRWLAIVVLLVALADQPVIFLLLPALAALGLVARGWSWLRRPVVWLQGMVTVLGVGARWAIYQLMIPVGTTSSAEPRAYVQLAQPFAGWRDLATFFADPNRLVPSILLAGGLVVALFLRQRKGAVWHRPVLSVAFVLGFVVIEMLLFVGTTWRDPRYLYPVLSLLFLGAEGVVVPAMRWLASRWVQPSGDWAMVGLTATLAIGITWGASHTALTTAGRDEWGYEQAFGRVGEAWVEGDALATIAPVAALVALGHVDYLAVEEGAQALVAERDGRPVDGWTGLPFLDSPERLGEALNSHPRLWFVADEMRLDRHFSPEYLHLLWSRFDLMAFERGTFVFLSRPAEPTPTVDRPASGPVSDELRLVSYAISNDRPEPGETVTITLRWVPGTLQGGVDTAFVHLVDQNGHGIVGHDAPPLKGLYPTARWSRSSRSLPLPDRHPLTLPVDLAPGRYRLEVGLYRSGSLEPVGQRTTLDFLAVGQPSERLPSDSLVASFEDGATLFLRGLEGNSQAGSTEYLQLAWQAGPAGFDEDYTVFIHLLDTDGNIAQQWDGPPAGGWYPTSYWKPGEVVTDDHDLVFDVNLLPGEYELIAGLYRADGTRLLLVSGADSVGLAELELQP